MLYPKKEIVAKTVATLLTVMPVTAGEDIQKPIDALSAPSYVLEVPTEFSTFRLALNNQPLLYSDIDYKVSYNIDDAIKFKTDAQDYIYQLEEEIASGLYTIEAKTQMQEEVTRLTELTDKADNTIDKISGWQDEYYYATKTFQYLIKKGYSKSVACAIIGNMMIETSGGTLALKPNVYDHTGDYYGLCQWSTSYFPETEGTSFDQQLKYLTSNIEYEFNTFGKRYYDGFNYNSFIKMKDPAEAALAFAKVYERCNSSSYTLRMQAAQKAYKYFTL